MTKYTIAWLPGDGVGPEVLEGAKIALDTVGLDAQYLEGDIGWELWRTEGNPLPQRTIDIVKSADACLFGAITSKPKDEAAVELNADLQEEGYIYESPILQLRQLLNLHTNLRPCKVYQGNPLNLSDDIDLVVVRENTEGLYAGVEFSPVPKNIREALSTHPKMKRFKEVTNEDMAISCRVFTRKACRTIITQAFEYARDYGYNSVTVVEKPNVLRETSGLMVQEARQIAKNYPEIDLWEANIDAMCMWLVKNPENYGVLVSSNMFGDIISDLAAQLVGGPGFAASANFGDEHAIFEPVHGSAPKYAGQNKVNPVAAIRAAKMLLDYLGEHTKANRIEKAIERIIFEGEVRTYDMGGSSSTSEMAEAIASEIE